MIHRSLLRPGLLEYRRAAGPETHPDDPRLRAWFGEREALDRGGVALIGFPCDLGVTRNGGRAGASAGPSALRDALMKLTPDSDSSPAFADLLEKSIDLGDLRTHTDPAIDETDLLLRMQRDLGKVVGAVVEAGGVPVVLGGGHETAFGTFLGLRTAYDPLTVINWDAHADVRPLIDGLGHSGSPFRQAIEADGGLSRYIAVGLQPHAVARAHIDYVRQHGSTIMRPGIRTDGDITRVFDDTTGPTHVSLDLDAVSSSDAPGVSAPCVDGFRAAEWLFMAEQAGQCTNVVSLDIVELNPTYDIDGRTARLAALTLWRFMRGVARRAGTEENRGKSSGIRHRNTT